MLTTSTDLEQTFLMLGVLKQSLAGRKSGVLSPSDVLVSDNTHMQEFQHLLLEVQLHYEHQLSTQFVNKLLKQQQFNVCH